MPLLSVCSGQTVMFPVRSNKLYGVVAKGLLTLFGSFYKEVAKTTPGTLVFRFERQTARKKVLPSRNTVSSIRMLSQEPSDSFIFYFNVILHGM